MPLTDSGRNLMIDGIVGTAVTAFDNTNAKIGVGDSSTAFASSQTDLQASTNKLRKAMDATFPSRSTNVLTFTSTFTTSDANFAWNEWATFNAASSGTMLSRKVESLGTKPSTQAWQFTVTLTITTA